MSFDVIIVGAGVAGLSAACRLMQQAEANGSELSVCVLEKGAEVGAHVLSGAIFDPRALTELFPDWETLGAPLHTPVERDEFYRLDEVQGSTLPAALLPPSMHNSGNYIISAGELTRWLGERAEALGVDIFPGFPAQSLLVDDGGGIAGVMTGDMGVDRDDQPKATFMPGMALYARYTLFAEGSRGHLGRQLIERFELDRDSDPQHYAIGLKELWEVPAEQHQPGLVVHGVGWPLQGNAQGGSFLYHGPDRQVMVGLIIDLNYANPWLSPFDEFQRLKHHPNFARHLESGQRIGFGARSITKGGYNSLPRMAFPGGLLIGCDAGTLDFSRIKGLHTAMKSGLLAADSVTEALQMGDDAPSTLTDYGQRLEQSWLGEELRRNRNFGPALHRFGDTLGGAWNWLDQKLGGRLPVLHDRTRDHEAMESIEQHARIEYPRPDNRLSFDKPSSVYLSNTNHDEDQPSHLRLKDDRIPIETNLPRYAEPAQRYCPVGVYEVVENEQGARFRINFQNCIHCKTCDIKDPSQNIVWTPPEGGGGPNYPHM